MLAAGSLAQGSFAALFLGLPTLAPALRGHYGLGLAQTGVLLGSMSAGLAAALVPWGLATDRFGERLVIAFGLFGTAAAVVGAALSERYLLVVVLLVAAGAFGASVTSGTGRAVMMWFEGNERGLALGIRQTSVPVAGVAAAVALPWLAQAHGLDTALLVLAAGCLLGSAAGGIVLKDRGAPVDGRDAHQRSMARDRLLWRLSFGSVLVCVAQLSLVGFLVLYLHDVRDLSLATAALALAGGQVIAAVLRIALGVWSDRMGSRIILFRRVSLALALALAAAAALSDAPIGVLFPALVIASGLSMSWNSLSFTAAAELGGARRSGSAIGIQQTALALTAVVVPILFGLTVELTSWRAAFLIAAAFPLLGWWVLRPLVGLASTGALVTATTADDLDEIVVL